MSKRRYMAAMILAAVSGSAVAAPKAEIVDFGVTVGRRMMAAPTPGGTGLEPAREMKNIRYLERADRIEARLCRNFGLTLKLSDAIPQILPHHGAHRDLHPQFTLPDGRSMMLSGFEVVSRDRLKAISADQLAVLFGSDDLEVIYLHLQSLRNLQATAGRLGVAPAEPSAATAPEPVAP